MKYFIALAATAALITGCGPAEFDPSSSFPDLPQDQVEIRMGYLPELGDVKCDRNMYAGFRSNQTEAVTFNINMVVMQPGASMQRHTAKLTLHPFKKKKFLAGQTRLFPAVIEDACKNVTVKMTRMTCTYGPNNEERACPGTIRWNWLQGFKMIETPSQR